MHSGLSTEAQAGRCPAEFPKLLCKMEMLPGGNSEIVGMLPSGCRRKLRNGMLLGGNSEIVGMLPSGCPAEILKCCAKMGMLPSRWWKFRNWGILCKDGGNVIKWQVQAETPKLWECYPAGAGGNSEIVGMLPSGCRRKLRNGMLLGGNSEIVGMLLYYQAGAGRNSEMEMLPSRNSEIVGMLPSARWRKFRSWGILCKDGNVTKRVPCGNSEIEGMVPRGNSDSVVTCEKSARNLPRLKFL